MAYFDGLYLLNMIMSIICFKIASYISELIESPKNSEFLKMCKAKPFFACKRPFLATKQEDDYLGTLKGVRDVEDDCLASWVSGAWRMTARM